MYHHWSSGWSWLWMSLFMLAWLVALGAIVYAAVRLAGRAPRRW